MDHDHHDEHNMFAVGDKVVYDGKAGVIDRIGCFKMKSTCSYRIKYEDESTEHVMGEHKCCHIQKQ